MWHKMWSHVVWVREDVLKALMWIPERPTNDLLPLLTLISPFFSLISPLLFLFIIKLELLIKIYLFFIDFFIITKFQCRSYLVHRFLLLQLQMCYVNVGLLWKWRSHGRNPTLDVGSFVAKFQRHEVDVDIFDGVMMKCRLNLGGWYGVCWKESKHMNWRGIDQEKYEWYALS